MECRMIENECGHECIVVTQCVPYVHLNLYDFRYTIYQLLLTFQARIFTCNIKVKTQIGNHHFLEISNDKEKKGTPTVIYMMKDLGVCVMNDNLQSLLLLKKIK